MSIWAGTTGELDVVPVADIRRFESEFLDYVGREHQGIYDAILQTGKLEDDTIEALEAGDRRVQGRVPDLRGQAADRQRARGRGDGLRRGRPGEGHPLRSRSRPGTGLSRWPATLRVLRRRIRAVTQTKQITKAMELIATSRIAKAQQRVQASLPYANELTRALSALASNVQRSTTRC